MTRILHVGNFGSRAKGAFQHSVEFKISNGLIRNGHQVINFSDREAAGVGTTIFGGKTFGGPGANRILLNLCRNMGPEVIFFGHADIITPETIGQIRADLPQVRMLQWNVDPIFAPNNVERLRTRIPLVDATLISTAGEALRVVEWPVMQLGFLPNPVDFSIERGRNDQRDDLPYDLFFACGNPASLRNLYGTAWNMDDLLSHIRVAVPGVRTRTPGALGNPHLAGGAYQNGLESAAIGLNISGRNDYLLYSSDRLAHMCGNGQAILIPRSTGYDSLFSEEEMAFFDSIEELTEQIAALIADPGRRRRIAAAGRARYHDLFNEKIVAKYMLDVALDRHDPGAYTWPTLLSGKSGIYTNVHQERSRGVNPSSETG